MMARFAQHRPGKEENQETVEEGKTSLSPAQTSLAQVDLTRIFPYDKKLRWASVRGARVFLESGKTLGQAKNARTNDDK